MFESEHNARGHFTLFDFEVPEKLVSDIGKMYVKGAGRRMVSWRMMTRLRWEMVRLAAAPRARAGPCNSGGRPRAPACKSKPVFPTSSLSFFVSFCFGIRREDVGN